MLVHVFDHDDRCIDHGADGDSNAAKRHDIGINALQVHDDECHENADGQADDHDDRGTQVEQEYGTNEGDDKKLLDELSFQCVDRPLDQI